MNEDFVTYEQAVQLKELGFDWKCFGYYLYNDGVSFGETPKEYNYIVGNNHISAPTLAQAQKWLYNHFGLWIEIIYEVKKKSFEYNVFNKSDNTKKSFFNPWVKIVYDTPTKALSAGIDKALEILKEYK